MIRGRVSCVSEDRKGIAMKAEVELPPLAGNWADGDVEIKYGVPPSVCLYLWYGEWVATKPGIPASPQIYAVRRWVPKIVTAGVLEPGWIVIDTDGTAWFGEKQIEWSDEANEWMSQASMCRLPLSETPQVTGKKAIWQIK